MIIQVRGISGNVVTLNGDAAWTARDVKDGLRKQLGVHPREQRIFAGGGLVELNDEDLVEAHIVDEDLLMVRRPAQQARWLARASRPRLHGDFDGCGLDGAPAEIRNDREVVLAALRYDWQSLSVASDELRADRAVVLAGVSSSGLALQYAADCFSRDREIVLIAVRQTGIALRFVDHSLRTEKTVVHAAVASDGAALQFVPKAFPFSSEFHSLILAAVRKDWRVVQYMPVKARESRDIMLAAVRQRGSALEYASEGVRADREVALAALKQDVGALQFIANSLKNDPEVQLTVAMSRTSANDSEVKLAAAIARAFPGREVPWLATVSGCKQSAHASPPSTASRPSTTSCSGRPSSQSSPGKRKSNQVALTKHQGKSASLPSLLPQLQSRQTPARPKRQAWATFKASDNVNTSARPYTT